MKKQQTRFGLLPWFADFSPDGINLQLTPCGNSLCSSKVASSSSSYSTLEPFSSNEEIQPSEWFHCVKFSVYIALVSLEYTYWLRIQIFYFSFIFINWRLITLQYCSGFCHTLTWVTHGFTCVPHPEPPSHLPSHPIPLGHPSAPALSTCLMHPTWTGDLFHTW